MNWVVVVVPIVVLVLLIFLVGAVLAESATEDEAPDRDDPEGVK